ncbi:MAG: 3-deoxy-7-phosphoheptulonate synthase [Casimicrobiaceae bacterium]
MIVVMQPDAGESAVAAVESRIHAEGLRVHVSRGTERTLIGAIGDERKLSPDMFETLPGVERALHILKPHKLVAREWHHANTVIRVRGIPIGGEAVQMIAGPCSVETEPQMRAAAAAIAAGGAKLMRGGAFKPRTSPYAFQGAGIDGLKLLREAAARHGLPIVTELMDVRMLDTFLREQVDVIQIGTRNMQNFDLLKEVGRVDVPVVLKRGMSATIGEWLMAAEYIAAGGNHRIILCERGIRTFETAYRNVLDVTAIAVMKRETHLPVIVDPSHAGGKAWMVPALASAAVAAGADGLLVEVHPNPPEAWCDADQALTPAEFARLMQKLNAVAEAVGRRLAGSEKEASRQREGIPVAH